MPSAVYRIVKPSEQLRQAGAPDGKVAWVLIDGQEACGPITLTS